MTYTRWVRGPYFWYPTRPHAWYPIGYQPPHNKNLQSHRQTALLRLLTAALCCLVPLPLPVLHGFALLVLVETESRTMHPTWMRRTVDMLSDRLSDPQFDAQTSDRDAVFCMRLDKTTPRPAARAHGATYSGRSVLGSRIWYPIGYPGIL